jgi:hypothetical protein
MSWSIRRSNVGLRVTKFSPGEPKPIAGLSPRLRAIWRAKRAKECRKVEFKVTQPPAPCNGWRIEREADILGSAAGLEDIDE